MTDAGFVLWFTGLPCSGKSTLSDTIEQKLLGAGLAVEKLDGDVVRKKLSSDLGFSKKDREENIRRVAAKASDFSEKGSAVLVSLVSPYRRMRDNARKQIGNFIEVYVNCPLEVCEKRDVKGLYALARRGQIQEFTGVSDPYEPPLRPEITVHTDIHDVGHCVEQILDHLTERGFLRLQRKSR